MLLMLALNRVVDLLLSVRAYAVREAPDSLACEERVTTSESVEQEP
jgi:hypothetical protein